MKEITGNLFDPSTYSKQITPDAICITVNGYTKPNGQCVMGRGCAKEAAERWPDVPSKLGSLIQQHGNRTMIVRSAYLTAKLINHPVRIVSFPVKPIREPCAIEASNVVPHMRNKFKFGDSVPGWACMARYDIIERSAKQLIEMADKFNWKRVVLPRPGTGNGGLAWSDVKQIVSSILDDRFYVITFTKG